VLLWYDFITSDATDFGGGPRPAITVVVLVATLATVVGAFMMRPKRSRPQPARIPHQRTPSATNAPAAKPVELREEEPANR
jgi:hypothetical protein